MGTIGNYTNLKEIGEGGFGKVFQAEHKYLRTKACLKQNAHLGKEYAELLRNEAQLLWQLDDYHSIPSVKDYFELSPELGVMVMSYIEGTTLEDIVEKKGRIHPEDVSWIAERLLGALHYCHYHGVVHSDVKPQNVFVEPSKRDIKLIDFGLSVAKPGKHTQPLGYTEKYAAPELVQGRTPLPETDLYGAGLVMLYSLGGDIETREFPNDTPSELKQFCDELLRYDLKQRPNWNRNLIQELSDIRLKVFGRRHTQ